MEENKDLNEQDTPEVAIVDSTTTESVAKESVENIAEKVEADVEVKEVKEAKEPKTKESKEEEATDIIAEAEASEAKKTVKKAEKSEEEEEQKRTPEVAPLVANEDFDWSIFEKDSSIYGQKDKETIAEQYDQTLSNVEVGEVVEGTIVSIDKREAVVNIGYKSEGIIPIGEFRYNPELAVGEKVEVYVESAEDRKGQLIISHKKARQLKSWDRVNLALENDEIIKGYIKCRTKGGMIVDVFGIEAFLPGSQIDVRPIRDYDIYVDKIMEFKVVKINQEFRNVVVSHKALIEAELEAQRKEIMSKLEKGQILEGTVKNITSYGVFIDLGGVDGLVHITDLSWGRVNHPEEIVQLDQKLNVAILDFDDQKKRIALGIKQLSPHPWDSLNEEYKVGDKLKGRVVVMADYGAFVEIAPGVEGLIHVSEMSWSQHLRSAQEFLKVGDEVDAVVLTLDREERKMSLGIKQLTPDPWDNIETKYPQGSKQTAKVRNFTNFGVFVEIEEGIDGLIHISDLSWTKKIKHPSEFTEIGADIGIVVLEVDKDNRRLSLGHKQLEENPWEEFEAKFGVDSLHQGKITEINDKGAVIMLEEDIEGFAGSKQLTKEDGSVPVVGDTLEFKVIEFSKATRRISLSHVRVYSDVKRAEESAVKAEKKTTNEATKSTVKRINAATEKTTLGDISDLAELKAKMVEDGEAKAKKSAAKKAEKVEKEIVAEKPTEKKAEKKVVAEKPTEEKAEKEIVAEKPAEEKAEKKVVAEKPAEEKAEKEIVAEKPAEKKAEKEIVAEKPAEEDKE